MRRFAPAVSVPRFAAGPAVVWVAAAIVLAITLLLGAAVGLGGRTEPVADSGNRLQGTGIDTLTDHLRRQPKDFRSWAALGLAYVEQARATGDSTYYQKAQGVIDRALGLDRGDDLALTAAGSLAAARHDFTAALRLADRAIAANPYSGQAYTVRTDALVELGRYDEAKAAALRADDLEPGLPTFTRLSYLAELRGDTAEATSLLRRSLDATNAPAEVAFVRFHLGELARGRGAYRESDREYAAALAADPTQVGAIAGRARVAAALGDTTTAADRYLTVVARLPLPEYVTEYGELLESLGRRAEAGEQYAVVRSAAALAGANGVGTDLETALFEADHGDAKTALRAATAEWGRRRSIHAADALAWALHVNGRDAQALPLARTATGLGTRDARLLYHRGIIEHSLGRTADAKRSLTAALGLDPHFSPIHGPRARAVLSAMPGARPPS
jgi:tetratricopeptide (TPR) repeat protein